MDEDEEHQPEATKTFQPASMDDSDAPLVIHEEDRSNDSLDLSVSAGKKSAPSPAASARSMENEQQQIPPATSACLTNNNPVFANQQHISSGNGILEGIIITKPVHFNG